jgi:hypothetical protein
VAATVVLFVPPSPDFDDDELSLVVDAVLLSLEVDEEELSADELESLLDSPFDDVDSPLLVDRLSFL